MTIDEAIKALERKLALTEMRNTQEKSTAVVKLSLEALKRIRKEREGTFTILLPGESEKEEAHSSTG
jgi:orotidine-5'-phosphate decarboxylase